MDEVSEIVYGLLTYDPSERWTAKQCLGEAPIDKDKPNALNNSAEWLADEEEDEVRFLYCCE